MATMEMTAHIKNYDQLTLCAAVHIVNEHEKCSRVICALISVSHYSIFSRTFYASHIRAISTRKMVLLSIGNRRLAAFAYLLTKW